MKSASRLDQIELSLIRQIHALATPLSLNLGLGEPNIAPDETLREMAGRAARGSWAYSPNAGTLSLRRRVCEGTPYDPATECCITTGTQEGFFALFTAWVEPGDEVLIPNPGFVIYKPLTLMTGGTPVYYPIEPPEWKLDASAVISRMTKKTKLIVVNSPSNPLGAVAGEETLREIAEAARERGCLVVSDEVYREIWYERKPPTMAGMGPNVVIANGMSKSHAMTGLRLGWLQAPAPVMEPILRSHQYITTCASVFSQSLAEMILEAKEWNAGWLASLRSAFGAQREAALYAIRNELGTEIAPPAGAFYTFVPVPSCDTLGFTKALATEAGVLIVPGTAFGSAGEGFVRISYAAAPEQVATGIERIGRWLNEKGR